MPSMLRPAATEPFSVASPPPERPVRRTVPLASEPSVYGFAFWMTYLAHLSMMLAVSILFHYADFVMFLGGGELELGLIVGAGMVGSLLMRLVQGACVDRYGPRAVWLASLVLLIVGLAAHLAVRTVHGPAIYLLQIVYRSSLAGAFGASITFVFQRAPVTRMAEAVGTLGTAGFIAMIIGAFAGDLLCGSAAVDRSAVDRMFLVTTGLALAALVASSLATSHEVQPAPRRRAPAWPVLLRYGSPRLLSMGVAMGVGLCLPGVFVRTFVAKLGIPGIATFFCIYAVSAFVTRLSTRRMPERSGARLVILLGMSSLTLSMLAFLPVRLEWHLALPAVLSGISHALIFPALVASGTAEFPPRYRGLATALMLASGDLGALIGAPLAGTILHFAELAGLPPYVTMFSSMAALLTAITIGFAIASRGSREG